MELTVIFNAIVGLISTGNYIGVLIVILISTGYLFWKKLTNIERTQKTKPSRTDYNIFIQQDSIVQDDLEGIRKEYDADRAIVLELRNGEVNIANIPSMKIHVRNEILKPMTFSVASLINGVPASFFSRPLRKMVKNETYELADVGDLKEIDFGLYQNLVSAKVRSMYAIPLFDNLNLIYGCLILEYCDKKVDLDDDKVRSIEMEAARLNGEILVMKKVESAYS